MWASELWLSVVGAAGVLSRDKILKGCSEKGSEFGPDYEFRDANLTDES